MTAPLVASVFVTYFGFGLGSYGELGERLNDQLDQEADLSQEDVDISSILFTPAAVTVEGSFSVETYRDAPPETFSGTESSGGYTIYEADGEDSAAIALSSDAIVFHLAVSENGPTAREAVEGVLDVRAEDGQRLSDADPEAAWVLPMAGSHQFVIAGFGDPELESGGDGERTYNL